MNLTQKEWFLLDNYESQNKTQCMQNEKRPEMKSTKTCVNKFKEVEEEIKYNTMKIYARKQKTTSI